MRKIWIDGRFEAPSEVFYLILKILNAVELVLISEFLEEKSLSFEQVFFRGNIVVIVLLLVEGEQLTIDVRDAILEVKLVDFGLESALKSVELGDFGGFLELILLDNCFSGGFSLLFIAVGLVDEGGV